MKITKRIWILCAFILMICIQFSNAQVSDVEQVQKELQRRNIPQEEVNKRMLERGFDVNNITPENLPEYEQALNEVIKEIESDKKLEENVTIEPKELIDDPAEEEEQSELEEPKSEIQDTIKENTQLDQEQTSEVYGHHIFDNAEISLYNATSQISTPPSYILTTGDVVKISIFGPSQADFEYTINEDGYIIHSTLGKIFLKGLNITQAKKLTQTRFSRSYRFLPEQFAFTLATSRTVALNIFGEVKQSGSYTISALNSGLNALVAAGGVSKSGSVRKIRLNKRSGETKFIDVYKYLSDSKEPFYFPIEDQDIIYVPLAGNIVDIQGAVKRPMKYEMLDDESLEELILYAGGLSGNASRGIVQVSRITDDGRKIIDVNLSDYLNSTRSFEVQDGDSITVKSVSTELKSFVEATGEVLFPGNFNFEQDMTLQDLIDKAEYSTYTRKDLVYIFRTDIDGKVILEKIDLVRQNPRNVKLQNRDRVSFFSLKDFTDESLSITIEGAVRGPNSFTFNPQSTIKISDLILLSGGLSPNAHKTGILKRNSLINKEEVVYEEVDVFKVIADSSSVDNIVLQEGDILTIYSNERYNNLGTVSVVGEVKTQDTIRYNPSLTLKKLLLISGGLKENANNIAILRRTGPPDLEMISYERLELDKIISGEKDIRLQTGDQLRVYDKNAFIDKFTISMLGEVNDPGVFSYDESLSLQDAIYMSGGLTFQASTNRVEVYRLEFSENQAARNLVKSIELEKVSNDIIVPKNNFRLEPFDIVIIRPIPDFQLQEVVYITGQVKYPGPYILTDKEVKLKDLVEKAGGVKSDGFAAGSTLTRVNGDKVGNIFIKLDDVLSNGNKHENIVMRAGDTLFIPKKENIITINTNATLSERVYEDTLLADNAIQISYQGIKSAKWYVNHFAGGLDKEADKKSLRVIEPNGRVRSTKRFLGIHNYPLVTEGSTIAVDLKPPKPIEEKKEPIDWSATIKDTFAILVSALTVVALALNLRPE